MRKLIHIWSIIFAILATGIAGSLLRPFPEMTTNVDQLINYQLTKIPAIEDGSVLFVGDSSLGSAISARVFREETGIPAMNLALVGSASTMGDYYLVRQALRSGRRIAGVVIMHSSDVWGRPLDDDSRRIVEQRVVPWSLESISLRIARQVPIVRQSKAYKTVFLNRGPGFDFRPDAIRRSVTRQAEVAARLAEVDYIPQGTPPRWEERRAPSLRSSFRMRQQVESYLDATIELCRERQIPVFLAVSPLWAKMVRRSEAYRTQLAAWLDSKAQATGATVLLNMAVPIPVKFLGDSEDHVLPDQKDEYTRWFAKLFLHHRNGTPAPPASPWT